MFDFQISVLYHNNDIYHQCGAEPSQMKPTVKIHDDAMTWRHIPCISCGNRWIPLTKGQ